jgi:N-acetyl-gamma-glutamyl-phosphate reductase
VGAGKVASWLDAGARVIDMSADFRLNDPALYPRWYGREHPAPELLRQAVFGLPELHAGELPDARLVAVPGCHSTAAILGLAPAVAADLVRGDVVVDSKTGVSGAGRSPSLGVQFSEVAESTHAYSIGGHRHSPEVSQELGRLANGRAPRVTLLTHLLPMVRGILASCYFDLASSLAELKEAYEEFYEGQPFTKVVPDSPHTKLASHTNLCLVNVAAQGDKAIVTAAIDNLLKGASGQGVECFNIAFGFDRAEALRGPSQWP